jgi:hypothetical protein
MNSIRVSQPQTIAVSARNTSIQALCWSLALFLVWTAATYLFEGRVELLKQSPLGWGRWLYVVVANILVGTIAATGVLRSILTAQVATVEQMGFATLPRTLLAIALAVVAGSAFLRMQQEVIWTPMLLLNAFAMVLQTTIAEVLVCWVVIGVSVQALAQPRGRMMAVLLAVIATDLLFGIYHYAHSAPFNQTWMVALLLLPGLVTSLVYFLGRDIYAAMIIQNCLGMVGVTQSVNMEFFSQPLYSLYLLTALSVIALIGAHLILCQTAKQQTIITW